MAINPGEWILQADYDLDTAKAMYDSGRYFYAVFMVHLSIEKGLKGLYWKVTNLIPPKTHNLKFLFRRINIEIEGRLKEVIFNLDDLSVPTRYPESLSSITALIDKNNAEEMIQHATEVLQWIKAKF